MIDFSEEFFRHSKFLSDWHHTSINSDNTRISIIFTYNTHTSKCVINFWVISRVIYNLATFSH